MSERHIILAHPGRVDLRRVLEGSNLTLRYMLERGWKRVLMLRQVGDKWDVQDVDGEAITTPAEIFERLNIMNAYGQPRHEAKL